MDPLLIVELLAVGVLIAAAMWLAGLVDGSPRRRRRKPEVLPVPVDSTLTSAAVTVSWAAGTRADWDRHVRPVLAREFADVVGGRRSAADRGATGELLFGPELWPLVDPADRFTRRLDRPGPGHETLDRILQRLEQA